MVKSFITAAKVSIVEALRAAYKSPNIDMTPNFIGIEYPEQEVDWPAILVEFNPSDIRWTGVMPDELEKLPFGDFKRYRKGHFAGTYSFSIYALTSQERDRLMDSIIQLFLMGDLNADTKKFFDTVENHDLISQIIMHDHVTTVGTTVSAGTPWGSDDIVYEGSLRVDIAGGEFYADAYDSTLVPLSSISVIAEIEGQEEDDAHEDWVGWA